MVNLVYGPVGSGKSTFIYDRMIEGAKAGRRVILIVPDQNILSAERILTDRTDGATAFDLEVLSFRRLPNHIFRQIGGISFNDIDDSGRLLVMWRVLRESSAFLRCYNTDERGTGFAELMLSAVNELKQYNVAPSMLDTASRRLESSHKALSDKLHDVSFIYGTYNAFLSNEYNDPTDELTRLSKALDENHFFEGYDVYFDAFDGFTPQQYRVVERIMEQADNVTFALCYDPTDSTGLFKVSEETYNTLNKTAKSRGYSVSEVFLERSLCFSSEDIAYVSKNLWKHDVLPDSFKGDTSHVETVCCHDRFDECEFVVSDILKKVSNGVRYKDILIIARDIDSYEGIIDSELENNGIPFFMSRRTDITSKPIFKLILAALAIHNRNWNFNDVISYIKTGLAGVDYDECDLLENYASSWNINGKRWYDGNDWHMNPDGLTDKFTDEGKTLVSRVNDIKNRIVPPLVKFFDCFSNATVADLLRGLYTFLCELNIREQIEEKAAGCRISGDLAGEKEYIQLWNILIETLDTVAELTGDMKCDGDTLATVLTLILGKKDIGTIPPGVDQVMLGNSSNLRAGSVSHVYLIGVNDGVFPKDVPENSLFSDSEKDIMKSVDLVMGPSAKEQLSVELFWFYRAVSSAAEYLTVSYTSSDLKGETNKLSVAGARVNYLLNEKPVRMYDEFTFFDKLYGKSIAMKLYSLNSDREEGIALKRFLEKDNELKNAIEAFDIPLEAGESNISAELASELYKGNISASQSKIDSFVKCSFDYHCRYILGLKEKKVAAFKSSDIGNFVHAVLENTVSRIATEDGIRTDIEKEELEQIVEECIADYIGRVCYGLSDNSPRIMHQIKRLHITTMLLIGNIIEEFRQSRFIPRFFELPINYHNDEGVEPYAIPLEDGTTLYMNGVADRVDTYKKGNDVYIRVVDYKTGTKTFSPDDIKRGLNLQMLLYLFAIWNTKSDTFKEKIKCEGDILPAGVLYFAAKAPDVKISAEDEIENVYSNAGNSIKRSGLLLNDMDVLSAMEKNFENRYIPVTLTKKGQFSKNDCLRTIEEFGELAKEIDGIVNDIAKRLKAGQVSATPLDSKKEDVCSYCKMKPICRRVGKEVADE